MFGARARAVGVLGSVSIVLAACLSPAPDRPPSAAATGEVPRRGGRIVIGTTRDIRTLQPLLAGDVPTRDVMLRIYSPLLLNDPRTGDLVPGLAERYELSSDGLTLTYALRPDLVWSDGSRLTAEDAKYTFEAWARSKRAATKGPLEDIVGYAEYADGRAREISGIAVADGGRRLTFGLRRGSCLSARSFAGPPIPKHVFATYWDSRTLDRNANLDDAPANDAPPVSSGPFRLKEWRQGDQIILVRNDRYYLGPPFADEVVWKIFATGSAVKAALLTGELTSAQVAPDEVAEVQGLAGASRLRLREVADSPGYLYVGLSQLSTAAPWLTDRRVRQALWYGLDIDAIVSTVRFGYADRVIAHTPRSSWAYDASGLDRYPYDPPKARRLLEAAGATTGPGGIYRWTDGKPMRIRIETSQADRERVAILEIAQQQYRGIGIEVEPSLMSFQALVGRLDDRPADVQGAIIAWALGPEPDAYWLWHSSQKGSNWTGFRNAELDAAVEAGRYGPDCTQAGRRKALAAMDRILNQEAPYVFLYAPRTLVFDSVDLVAPPPGPYARFAEIEKWWLRR